MCNQPYILIFLKDYVSYIYIYTLINTPSQNISLTKGVTNQPLKLYQVSSRGVLRMPYSISPQHPMFVSAIHPYIYI